MSTAAPANAIERFAQLCAQLDNGSLGDDILAAAGLDEAGWQALSVHWLPQLAAGEAPDLALRFATAYARARRYPGGMVLSHASPVLGSVVSAELDDADTDADVAPPIALAPDYTLEGALLPAGPALPFRTPTPPPAAPIVGSPDAPVLRAAIAAIDVTLPVPSAAPAPGAVLPFCAPTADGRILRLQRFDTVTGAPLEVPRWVHEAELPAHPH